MIMRGGCVLGGAMFHRGWCVAAGGLISSRAHTKVCIDGLIRPAATNTAGVAVQFQAAMAASLCQLVQATKENDDLNQCTDADVVKDILNKASSRREVFHTKFLAPPSLKESLLQIKKLANVKAIPQGGYPEAERCRLSVGNSEALKQNPVIVVGMCITGNFIFQPCSYGDFLGAILGTGIQRDMLGDIILQGEMGAQILVVPGIISFLLSSLKKVGNVPVSCREIPLHAIEYTPTRTKLFKSFEASLRLDAVASAGFKISRAKMASLISDNDVLINCFKTPKKKFRHTQVRRYYLG